MIRMTVQVTTPNTNSTGAPTSTQEHPEAGRIEENNGHLLVRTAPTTGNSKTTAIYAPGRWFSAKVTDTGKN